MNERQVNMAEAQERLPELVDDAERGEILAITRNGREVARLMPPGSGNSDSESAEAKQEALERRAAAFRRFNEKADQIAPVKATLEEIQSWIREGRTQ